jgi:hypothetical protein
MKLGLEYGVIFLISCFMLTILVQFASLSAQIHKGHLFLDYVVSMVEDYDGDLELVNTHMSNSTVCKECTTLYSRVNDRYEVEVSLPISIASIGYFSRIRVTGITSVIPT